MNVLDYRIIDLTDLWEIFRKSGEDKILLPRAEFAYTAGEVLHYMAQRYRLELSWIGGPVKDYPVSYFSFTDTMVGPNPRKFVWGIPHSAFQERLSRLIALFAALNLIMLSKRSEFDRLAKHGFKKKVGAKK